MLKSIQALTEKREGKLFAIASDEKEDRLGDVIKADGWDLKSFKKNPVLQFAHRYDTPPVGVAKKIKVKDGKLTFEPVFHELTEMAKDVKKLYEADPPIMKAFSVGFIPLKFENEKGEAVEGNPFGNNIIAEAELLEISAVPVPANARALTETKEFKKEDSEKVCKWINGQLECKKIEKKEEIKEEIKEEKKEEFKEEKKEKEKEEKFTCECLECGYKMETDKHCKDIKCPKCDGKMRRIERPGAGKEIELKEGRVLSGKNRDLISNSIETLNKAISALQNLLNATESQNSITDVEPPAKSGESKSSKSREPEVKAQKLLKNRVTVRALQKVAGDISHILQEVKKEKKNE